jgi:hypothetical protein
MLHPIMNPPQSFKLDFNSLAFMLRSSDPDLLNRLAVTQERFSTLMLLLEQRSNLHARFQDRTGVLQREGAFPAGMFTLDEEIADKVGQQLIVQLKVATDHLFVSAPEASEIIVERLKEVQAFIRAEFPKERPPSYQELPLVQGEAAAN